MKHTEIKNRLRKESGIDKAKDTFWVKAWVSWLKDHNDISIQNIGYALEFGTSTGRIPNINYEGQLTNVISGKPLTNLQVITAFAKTAVNQDENTTAAGLKSLQTALGLKAV